MTITRFAASTALAAALGFAVLVPPGTAGAATPPPLPQTASADAAAAWLAGQFASGGSIPSTTSSGPDLSATANAVLALAAAGVDTSTADAGLSFLEGQVNAYVAADGSDGPGQLALLILDAHALGVAPNDFGGSPLVTRLLATQQSSGPEAGMFGTTAQADDYLAGDYQQGLALAALAAAGVTGSAPTGGAQVTAADSWLEGQQCPDGGWTSLITTSNPCNGSPAEYAGPDTNSTALAVQGLEAQGALGSAAAASALLFLKKAQDPQGGWGYEPGSRTRTNDPDSTALVLQALLALGAPPSSRTFTKAGVDGVASLESDQLSTGAIEYPGEGADLLATYQAIPALAGVTFAYDLGSPVVTGVAPSRGGQAGGTRVRITGSGFAEVGSVLFGTTPATSFTLNSGTSITAVAPAGTAGTVEVTVTSPAGTSPATGATVFTYRA
jgi:hypothetical protein